MFYGKNLTGERKATFSVLDVTQSLNIDDNGSFLSSGNIFSTGNITAVHGDYDDMYVKSLSCGNASFTYVDFDEQWTGVCTTDNLSFLNGCFTTLNNIDQCTFGYIGSLKSDAHAQTDNVSALAHNTYNTLDNLSTTVSSVSGVAYNAYNTADSAFNSVDNLSYTVKSVSTVANAAYNNVLNLAATVTGLGQSLDDTNTK